MSECSAIATFLAGRKLSRIGIDSDRSSISTVLDRTRCSVRSTSKSSGVSCTGVPAPGAPDRVADRALDVEVERVAELVGLGVVGRARGRRRCGLDLVLADLVLRRACVNRSPSAFWPIRRMPRGRQLEPALLVLDEAGLLEHLGQLGHLLEAARRRRRRAARGPGRCRPRPARPGWVAPRSRFSSWSRSPSCCSSCVGLAEAQRVLAGEVVAPVPVHRGNWPAQVLAELVDLPAQVHVLEQLVGELLELGPLLGRHRVEHRLHRRPCAGP